jgi:hypothetical protein
VRASPYKDTYKHAESFPKKRRGSTCTKKVFHCVSIVVAYLFHCISITAYHSTSYHLSRSRGLKVQSHLDHAPPHPACCDCRKRSRCSTDASPCATCRLQLTEPFCMRTKNLSIASYGEAIDLTTARTAGEIFFLVPEYTEMHKHE